MECRERDRDTPECTVHWGLALLDWEGQIALKKKAQGLLTHAPPDLCTSSCWTISCATRSEICPTPSQAYSLWLNRKEHWDMAGASLAYCCACYWVESGSGWWCFEMYLPPPPSSFFVEIFPQATLPFASHSLLLHIKTQCPLSGDLFHYVVAAHSVFFYINRPQKIEF